jgi:hypothetical protein
VERQNNQGFWHPDGLNLLFVCRHFIFYARDRFDMVAISIGGSFPLAFPSQPASMVFSFFWRIWCICPRIAAKDKHRGGTIVKGCFLVSSWQSVI